MKQFFIFLLFSIFTFTNSILAEQIFSEEAKEMMDDHVKSSELLKVPLPKINRIIKDFDRYKDYRTNVMAKNWSHTNSLWKEEIGGKILTKELCVKAISEFEVPSTPTIEEKILSRNHTENILSVVGAKIKIKKLKKGNLISLHGQQDLDSFNLNIPGDPSAAAFFVALALLTKNSMLRIKNINLNILKKRMFITDLGVDTLIYLKEKIF